MTAAVTTVTVLPADFVEQPEMPLAHEDERRIITERVESLPGTDAINRVTQIEVIGIQVPLGDHFHDFDEAFAGIGGGVLYTAPADEPTAITQHDLPEGGWTVTIPAGVVHTFVLSLGAMLVSRTDRYFVSEKNQHEYPGQPINTHGVKLPV